MISMCSNELNLLILRYLQESGFSHSASALENDAGISRGIRDDSMVPQGALLTFVQKGIQHLEGEAMVNYNDADIDDAFSSLQSLDLITKNPSELQKIVNEKKESVQKTRHGEKEKDNDVSQSELDREPAPKRKKVDEQENSREREHVHGIEKEQEREREHEIVNEKGIEKFHGNVSAEEDIAKPEQMMDVEAVDIPLRSISMSTCIVTDADVMVLNGHASEVMECAWSPSGPLLASGGADSIARIWTMSEGPCNSNMQGVLYSVELNHAKGGKPSQDVSALDWNTEGTLLATASNNGQARIWSGEGELVRTLDGHKMHIYSLKWNKKGDYLLSASADKSVIVWDVKTGKLKQQFNFSGSMCDADWRNDVSFATCSSRTIYVCKVGYNRPIKTFSGHQDEVNAVKWDPTGQLLASCSDDSTVKIWSMEQETCLHDLKEHTLEIYTIKWSPTGPGTNISYQQQLLASVSCDCTIKLWDVESGSLLYSLNGHRDPVCTVAFSPNGDYLATGSHDSSVNVWSIKEARIVKTYSGNGEVFEVCWNKEGDKVAACFENHEVCVFDFRM